MAESPVKIYNRLRESSSGAKTDGIIEIRDGEAGRTVNEAATDYWFRLRKEKFINSKPDARGILRSRTFPGLWLNAPALLAGEMSKVFDTLNEGLKSKEHAAFVKRLAKKMKSK